MIQLLVGAVLGATTALLLAPSSGAGTRAKLMNQGKRVQYNLERLGEFAVEKRQQCARKLLGFQQDLECVKNKAQEKAEVLKHDLSELKKDFDETVQEFRAPSEAGQPQSSR